MRMIDLTLITNDDGGQTFLFSANDEFMDRLQSQHTHVHLSAMPIPIGVTNSVPPQAMEAQAETCGLEEPASTIDEKLLSDVVGKFIESKVDVTEIYLYSVALPPSGTQLVIRSATPDDVRV